MFRKSALLGIAFLFSVTAAIAQGGAPLKAKNLEYARAGEAIIIPAAEAPQGIKVGDKFNLVDASKAKITGTGTVSGPLRKGSNTGEITGWSITVDTIKK